MSHAYITGASGPARARPGQRIRLRLTLRRTQTGARIARTVAFRIPLDASRGERTLRLTGTPADVGSNPDDESDLSILFEDDPFSSEAGPQNLAEVAELFEALHRYDGITIRFAGRDRQAYRDPALRITGEASVTMTIRR